MKRSTMLLLSSAALLALILALPSPSHAATLRVQGTFPTLQNIGTCAAPLTVAADSGVTATRIHYRWRGNATGEDSVNTLPGQLGALAKSVPTGAYTITAWPSWVDGGVWIAGCADSIVKVVGGAPNRVMFGARVAPNPAFRSLIPAQAAETAGLEQEYQRELQLRDAAGQRWPRTMPFEP
jgi:hypothetical protein